MSDKILFIVESPNKIQTLRSFLPSNYIVMASVGHISDIKDGGSYWNTGIDPTNDFKTNYAVSDDKKKTVEDLKDQVARVSKVIIASDEDREGEAIAWSLKKFLKIPNDKYERVTFQEITKSAVLKALDNPRKIDGDLVDAAHSRGIVDKIIGYRLSPIARKQIQARSVGRCQSAGLKVVVDREKEIQNFVPETYYDLILNFKKDGQDFRAKYIGTKDKEVKRLNSLDEVKAIVNECKKGSYSILDITTKEKLSNPKPPFITSTFQQEVSSKLGISVKLAQSYAQKLFEGIEVGGQHVALITYIRTDSVAMSPEFQGLLERYVKNTYGNEYYAPLKKVKNSETSQEAHECIRCIDLDMTPNVLARYVNDEKLLKVYTIIYKRTVASMMAPQRISETTYIIGNGEHRFELVSKEELFDGYKKVYGSFEDDEEIIKVTFDKGYILKDTSLESNEKQTTPPSRFKEATFIKEIEKLGIGRPSTFSTILETVISESRGYAIIEDKCIVPTQKGIELVEFLDKNFQDVVSIDYTSKLEEDLDKIASGKVKMLDFLNGFYTTLEDSASKFSKGNTQKAQPTNEVCPLCGAPMVLRTNKFNGQQFYGCSKFPKCKGVKAINS